jgi:hypothetical protein
LGSLWHIYAQLSKSEAVTVAAEATRQRVTVPASIAFARAQLEAGEGIAIIAIVGEAWTNLDHPLTFGVNKFQLKRNQPRTSYMHYIFRCIYICATTLSK